ncbi:uncharacterized protein LOC130747178 [Lotus japonicus]|uniref:uncharacterized protein LOC130747178 n=1 Tax=Lotus japonicus TaxID=34305 RepID=UPI0025907ACF|nr:uncharacterized protein LOC130747178 [Lotus japonicus]
MYNKISYIVAGKIEWKIKVRVLHLWETKDYKKPQITNSIDLLLIDEQNSKIHATIKRGQMNQFKDMLGEGKVYMIQNFMVQASDKKFRVTKHKYKISFLVNTKIEEATCDTIPSTKFEGAPVMLLRNIDQSAGLCNGTRLIITEMGKYVLEGKVISGTNAGKRVAIPRLTLTPSDRRIPFKFQRRQFPIVFSFAMTINKSQGQSLKSVGLYLPKPVFSHGQLYVAFSRVTHRKGLKILICDGDDNNSNSTSNVVYKEVFRNVV